MEFSSLAGPTTGRSLVLFAEGAAKPGMAAVQAAVGPSIAGGDGSGTESVPHAGRGRRRRAARAGHAGRGQRRDHRRGARAHRLRARDPRRTARHQRARAAAHRAAARRDGDRPGAAVHAHRRARGPQRRLPAGLPRRGAAPHGGPHGRRHRRRGSARRRPRARRDPGDLGAAGDQGRQLLPLGREDRRRGARHRASTRAPGLRGPHVTSQSFVPGEAVRTATATARTASAPPLGAQVPAEGPAALRRRPRGARSSPARCSATPGSGTDSRHPRRHQLGGRERVRGGLDVARARRRSPGQPFSQVFERVAARARRPRAR